MAMTPYNGKTLTIANIGTTPQERAMDTSEFKMAFSKDFHEFVEWFNDTHKTDFDAVQTEITSHKADNATETKKGHVEFATVEETLTGTDTTRAVHPAGAKALLSTASARNKNILHNWDFRNPVNQRGFTSGSNEGYTIDRWRLATSGHTAEVVSDGIKLIADKNAGLDMCFAQIVENYSRFVGVPLTLSIHVVENTLTQGCRLRRNENSGPLIMGTGYFSYTFTPSSLSYLQIGVQFANRDVDDGKYVIIDKMKLEIGNVSTLANDPPADYQEQLSLCKPIISTVAPTYYLGNDGQWQVY